MQQASEAPINTTDAAPADVITSPEAAARKCPECESLMYLETSDESGHHDEEEDGPWTPLLRCPNQDCGHVADPSTFDVPEAPAATQPAVDAKSMVCETCGVQVLIQPLSSGHGFKLIAIEREATGITHESAFGSSPNGFPLCPVDGVALIPVGPTPVGEAFRGIKDALQPAEPVQPRLPHTAPPFDVESAFRAICRKNREVAVARDVYDAAKKEAKEAKDALDEETLLSKMIDEYSRRQKDAAAAARGTLLPEQNSVCEYERRTGQTCFICREARKKAKADGSNEPHQRLVSVAQHLERRGFFIGTFAGDTEALLIIQRDTPEVFDALERWAHDESAPSIASVSMEKSFPSVAALVKRSCIAGPHGEGGQHCERCGTVLVSKQDDGDPLVTYPEGASVGLDCAGAPGEEGDKPEPARQPRRRHNTPAAAAAAKTKAARETKSASEKKPATKARAKGPKQRTRSR